MLKGMLLNYSNLQKLYIKIFAECFVLRRHPPQGDLKYNRIDTFRADPPTNLSMDRMVFGPIHVFE